MAEMTAMVLTIASDTDFFSRVWPQVLETQPRIRLLQPYTPVAKVHMAKYRAPVLSVEQARTKPKTATTLEMVMCQTRSLK